MGKTKRYGDRKRYKEKFATNEHHKINKCRGGTNKSPNIERVLVDTHRALHKIFGNETPAECLKTMLDFFDEVLAPSFKKDLLDVLKRYKGMEHNPECYYGNRIKGKGQGNTLLKYNYNKNGGQDAT